MKKYITALLITVSAIGIAAEYEVNISVPVRSNVVVNSTATSFVLERFSVDVVTSNTAFLINGSYRDSENKVLKRKVIPVKMGQAKLMMVPYALQISGAISAGGSPLEVIMFYAKQAVEANIQTLLGEE